MNYFKDNYYLPKKYSIFTGAGKNGVLNCILIYSFYFIGINLRRNRKGSDIQWCYFCTSFTQMTMFLLDSKSTNTNKSYLSSFDRWHVFIKEHGYSNLSADSIHIALYITHLIDKQCFPNVMLWNGPMNWKFIYSITSRVIEMAKRQTRWWESSCYKSYDYWIVFCF